MKCSETDHYVQSAEMYDLLSEPHWISRRDSVCAALSPMAQMHGNVLDIGAGTGACVQIVAQMLPHVNIYAVEPSASMRVGLMARVLHDPDLRKRVTICAEPFQSALLPERLDLVVACGCIGYFDQEDRTNLWHRLSSHLAPQGSVLVDVMALDRPREFADTCIASTKIGAYCYDIWLDGHPGEGDIMRWKMRFEVRDNGQIVRQFSIERDWHAFGIDQLAAEAAEVGFVASPLKNSPVPAMMLRLNL